MTTPQNSKTGLLGLGKVGRNVLRIAAASSSRANPVRIGWVADSKSVLSKEDRPLTPKEIEVILEAKQGGEPLAACEARVPHTKVEPFRNASEEVRILRSVMTSKDEWIVLDTASVPPEDDYEVVSSLMGSAGVCTASKMAWADFGRCSTLFRMAERRRTLLGLNCTLGVWVDQMESLPLVLSGFVGGRLTISKRDNSSFNLFFAKLQEGLSPDEILRQLEESGHLEPGAKGLSGEVGDQTTKASITSNVCAVLRGIEPRSTENVLSSEGRSGGPKSLDAHEIADWHMEGRKKRVFRCLVTEMTLETGDDESLRCSTYFGELPKGSPLARQYPGKSAVAIEAKDASFRWSTRHARSKHVFIHSGYGGAPRTAAKLIWEVRRISRLTSYPTNPAAQFSPLPILYAERLGLRTAVSLNKRLAREL